MGIPAYAEGQKENRNRKVSGHAWNKFTLKTKTDAEDIVISALADAGVEGVEIEDKVPLSQSDKQQMFVDILPDGPADDGIAYLSFYLEEDADTEAILARVDEELETYRRLYGPGRMHDRARTDRG